jgi:hypothetical protein
MSSSPRRWLVSEHLSHLLSNASGSIEWQNRDLALA